MIKKLLIGLLISLIALVIAVFVWAAGWECDGIVEGKLIDGGGWFTYTRCTSGREWISHSTEAFPTPAKARSVFEDRIGSAITVIERNQKLGANGEAIGDRAVTISRDSETGERFAAVFWVDDRVIVSIRSTSVYYARYAEWTRE
jgi:hypothetical protein